jgi:mRNA-degrading endonuclease RelE of RelBE toxin-antitoxin system
MRFEIVFAAAVESHLRVLTAAERARVLDEIERNLGHEPLREARNRRPLRPNPVAPWELRVGALRVFYETGTDSPATVRIVAIGKKRGNVLSIGGKEIKI